MTYKYYPPNEFSFCAIMSEYFWCSKRKFLNDPFDTHGEVIKRFPIFIRELQHKKFNLETYPTILDMFGICCFSEDVLNKHLWSFYADSYKGWCLEFEDEKFEENISKQELCKVLYKNVQYLSEWPNLDDLDTHIPTDENETMPVRSLIRQYGKDSDFLFEYLMLIKDEAIWGNEKEKRILLGNGFAERHPQQKNDNGYKLTWPKGILKRIIVGHNISTSHFDTIKQIAKCKQVPLFMTRTIESGFGFELEIEEIKMD